MTQPKIKADSYLQLRITLQLNPGYYVWRRIWISADSTFSTLHGQIQKAFGWEDYHWHRFEFGTRIPIPEYTLVPADEFNDTIESHPRIVREDMMKLSDCFHFVTDLLYVYDYGDCWKHDIHLEKILDSIPENEPTGEGDTPPEDVGGKNGFDEFRKAVHDPNNPEYEHYRRWAGMKTNDKRWR